MALALGLRQGEVLGLRWQDVDFETRRLTVRASLQRVNGKLQLVETKTPMTRSTKELPQVALSSLAARIRHQEEEKQLAGTRWQDSDFVFTTSVGTPIDKRNLIRTFHSILKKAHLKPARFHDLRHSAATLLLIQGVHPRYVMDLLGHSDISLTMNTYSHVLPTAQREVAAKMDAILNPVAVNLAVNQIDSKAN